MELVKVIKQINEDDINDNKKGIFHILLKKKL